MFYFLQFHGQQHHLGCCVNVSCMVKKFIKGSLGTGIQGHETNLGSWGLQDAPQKFLGPSRGSEGMLPQKILKMEPLRLAKNAFPAYSYGHEVS